MSTECCLDIAELELSELEDAVAALGSPRPDQIVHVGDDWAADVVGSLDAGWRAAWMRTRPGDSPLPSSERDEGHVADLELDDLRALPAALGRAAPEPIPG